MSDSLTQQTSPVPAARRGAARAPQTMPGDAARDEQITVLDPTPPPLAAGIDPTLAHTGGVSVAGEPGARHILAPSSEVVGSVLDRQAPTQDQRARVEQLARELGIPVAKVLALVPGGAAGASRPEVSVKVRYYRYTGEKDRKFTMPQGAGRPGYSAMIRPGKVLSDKDYPLAALKSQGFLPGRNLEEIPAEEAKAG